MTRYKINNNVNNLHINFNLRGGASSSSNPYGKLKLVENLDSYNFNLEDSDDSKSETSSDEYSDFTIDTQPKINLDLYKLHNQPTLLRSTSNPTSRDEQKSEMMAVKGSLLRSRSQEEHPPPLNPEYIVISSSITTPEQINAYIVDFIETKIGIKVSVEISPTEPDGSCGLASVLTHIYGKVPNSMTAYHQRGSIPYLDTLNPKTVLEMPVQCHGENIEAEQLIHYVKEEIDINLVILDLNQNIIWLPLELENKPMIVIVGDGHHYNPIKINGLNIIPKANPFYKTVSEHTFIEDEGSQVKMIM